MTALAVALALSGCDGRVSAVDRDARSTAAPYAGALDGRAAVAALECDGEKPYARATAEYDLGLETVKGSAEDAFDDYLRSTPFRKDVMPTRGYRLEREQAGRALISYDVGDRTKLAVVLRDGIRDWDGAEGWGVVEWAQCDPAEFPAAQTEQLNIGVWTDARAERIPVAEIQSFQGHEHCDWQHITFLLVGPGRPDEDRYERADWYVRDEQGEFTGRLLRGTFARGVELPGDARNTHRRRSGRELWLTPDKDAAYLVRTDDPGDVERWPAATRPILCA